MEKIVTKIGDVTIERRVSKPQPPKAPVEPLKTTFQHHKFSVPKVKPDEAVALSEFTIKQESPDPNTNDVLQDESSELMENNDLKAVPLCTPGNHPKQEFASLERAQKRESGFQNADVGVGRLESEEKEIRLPKVRRIDYEQKQFPSNINAIKPLINGPDLSKLVGISIERRKRVDIESQPTKPKDSQKDSNPSISIPPVKSEVKPENDLDAEDFDESYDEEEFEEESAVEDVLPEEVDDPEPGGQEKSDVIKLEKEEDGEISEEVKDLIKKETEDIEEGLEDGESAKGSDINDLACTDLVELMQKGEIEGEIEDVKDVEEEEDEKDDGKGKEEGEGKKTQKKNKKKKKKVKKKNEGEKEEEEEDAEDEDEDEDEDEEDKEKDKDKNIDKSKITNANLRKNIREVMDETKLDEATLAAQRQEAERLKRLQEQQKIIRELQRQIAMSRQSQKTQNKVLSLLQGNSQTSILKTSSATSQAQTSPVKSQNSVLVKLSNGEQTSLNNKKMMELLKNSKNKSVLGKPPIPKTLLKQGLVTPSVTIAPIAKKEPVDDKKKRDVVTLSSDSEDDCIVLSDEDESEPEEDPTNSGMHTNDKYNLPDDKGRVVVNVGHPESETDLYLAPQIARIIKPHQIGGIRFLYDNVIESIERYQTSTGFGCILAHSMGLGKTLQIVSFSDIFLRYTSAKTILCIMPINTIQNWLAEFNMWLPKESNLEDVRCRDFDLFIVNESLKNLNARAKVILDWHKFGGVLLMGYELFRLLSLKKLNKSKKKKKDTEEENAKNRELIEEVYSALVLPGPDLVICDEGHRIKNSHATTSQALKQIRTKRRIVLTGYPLQNNLLEYWCMVDFVRPNYLGTKTEFSNMFERPIQNGQCIDSTPQDKRLMRYRAHVLHSLLEGFVQRRSHAVLQSTLPEKEEYVLLLRFTPFQRKLYDTFMNEVVRTVAVPNPLKAFAVCCKIWNHPDVLYNFLKKKGEEIDLDLEEALPPSLQTPQYPYGQQCIGPDSMSQQGHLPGTVAWPKRGPGSRGGKIRQSGIRRIGRGRKPAASITPNVPGQEKTDSFNSGQFPLNENFPNHHETVENFQGRNYNQSQFGFNDYSSQSGNFSNSSFSKNPLNNLEDMSTGNFQNKQFFPQQNNSGSQGQYGNMCQNFENSKNNFNPNCSSESNLSSSFESNLNSTDSNYNQTDYNPDFNSEFYSNNNYQNSGNSVNYSSENKSGYQGNSYFQNPGFRNSDNFNYTSAGNNMEGNFQNYEQPNSGFQNSGANSSYQSNSGTNFQSSNRNDGFPNSTNQRGNVNQGSNFQGNSGGNFQNPASNQRGNVGQGSDFQNQVSGNFQGNFQGNSNFEGNRNQNFTGQNSNFSGNGSNTESVGESFQGPNPNSNFQGSNYGQGFWPQSNWGYPETSKGNTEFRSNSGGGGDFMSQKFNSYEEGKEVKNEEKPFGAGNNSAMYNKGNCDYSNFGKSENDSKFAEFEEKGGKPKEEEDEKKEDAKGAELLPKKEDASLPYDWATDLFKNYVTGIIENSSKMEVFFHIVTESIKLGDRLLVFSQSLLTLDLIEDYLHRQNVPDKTEVWAKNKNYFRLDGSTPGLEREKLINEFNSNTNIYLFLVSTRAGSLGINLVGANRVVVFDASWNPCHDTQAVCRVYRYGQRKPCFVYRLVMDSCLEKKIYDRQVNKQGMADRVVDELNPDAHLSIKEVTNLCWDDQEDTAIKDFSHLKEKYNDEIVKILLDRCSKLLSKEPFQHESLLIDRKEKKLSQAEKRLAKRSYELEKQAANQPKNIYSFFPNTGQRNFVKPIASVRPMQSEIGSRLNPQLQNRSKWIPAEVWQKQGMSAQEMTLPLDVMIPTSSPEKTSIVLKAGQRVMVLKSPKGIYMQLENGKIIAIRSAFKVGQNGPGGTGPKPDESKKDGPASITPIKPNLGLSPKMPSQPIRPGMVKQQQQQQQQPFMKPFAGKVPDKKMPVNMAIARSRQVTGKAKPFMLNRKYEPVSPDMKQRMMAGKMGLSQEVKFAGEVERSSGNERPASNTSFPEEKIFDSPEEKTEDKTEEKSKINDSLETLRKVTESISDTTKRDVIENEGKYPQVNVKNYRQNFSSQTKENIAEEEKKNDGDENNQEVKKSSTQQQGNENVQNWPPNQSYPPVDPYGNYFPGYYYGPGPGPMMPPYDGFYPPTNYGPHMGRNSSSMSQGKPQPLDKLKPNPHAAPQPIQNQTAPNSRNPPGVNTPPMYPPYPNPYAYPYNYPSNPNFNNQGFPFSNQNQSGQQGTQNPLAANTGSGNPNQPYDSSMYSAFHRPDPPFQSPDNPYQSPYPRPPYPNSGTPGFFPYNPPYPNYPYGPNFNPYMHPANYGYPVQNPVPVSAQNPIAEGSLNDSDNIGNS